MIFGQSSGSKDKGGAKTVDADRSRFVDDIPANIVRTIDKTSQEGGGAGYGGRGGKYGSGSSGSGGSGRSGGSKYGGGSSGSSYAAAQSYGGGGGNGGRGGGVSRRGRGSAPEPERDPTMDFMTELSNDISRQTSARRSPGGGGYGSAYGNASGRGRQQSPRGGVYGGGGGRAGGRGGRSYYESERSRDAGVFMEKRNAVEKAKYPVPVVSDGGKRMARDSGEGVDTSWAAKLARTSPVAPELPPGVSVGAKVRRHGGGSSPVRHVGEVALSFFLCAAEPLHPARSWCLFILSRMFREW